MYNYKDFKTFKSGFETRKIRADRTTRQNKNHATSIVLQLQALLKPGRGANRYL